VIEVLGPQRKPSRSAKVIQRRSAINEMGGVAAHEAGRVLDDCLRRRSFDACWMAAWCRSTSGQYPDRRINTEACGGPTRR
jgi:hypothetical protein